MEAQDILLNATGDLSFKDGDFEYGLSDQQHMLLIVELFEGSIKQFPLQGVGISQYEAASGQSAIIKRDITVKATADGFQNVLVQLFGNESEGNFTYNITAERP